MSRAPRLRVSSVVIGDRKKVNKTLGASVPQCVVGTCNQCGTFERAGLVRLKPDTANECASQRSDGGKRTSAIFASSCTPAVLISIDVER